MRFLCAFQITAGTLNWWKFQKKLVSFVLMVGKVTKEATGRIGNFQKMSSLLLDSSDLAIALKRKNSVSHWKLMVLQTCMHTCIKKYSLSINICINNLSGFRN
jgi:hypothetical protein